MHPLLYAYLPLEGCSDLALLFVGGCGDCKSLRQFVLVTAHQRAWRVCQVQSSCTSKQSAAAVISALLCYHISTSTQLFCWATCSHCSAIQPLVQPSRMMLWIAGQSCMPQTQQFQESSPMTTLSLMFSCIDAFDMFSMTKQLPL